MLISIRWQKKNKNKNKNKNKKTFLSKRRKNFMISYIQNTKSWNSFCIWTEMFLCHPIEISISLECLYQASQFFHHCKGKSMTYLEMDIIFSTFFLFLKYGPHLMIVFFVTHPVHQTDPYVLSKWMHSNSNFQCWHQNNQSIGNITRSHVWQSKWWPLHNDWRESRFPFEFPWVIPRW